jgi:hypothetical protein
MSARAEETSRKEGSEDSEDTEGTKDRVVTRKVALLWIVAMLAFAGVGGIVFILTEDITTPVVLSDSWTLVQVLFFVLVISCGALTVLIRRKLNSKRVTETGGQDE